MKQLLKQPWFWILLADLTYLFILWPLSEKPEILFPVLPEAWYDLWEEFAVMHLEYILSVGMLFLVAASIGIAIFGLFSKTERGFKKAGNLAGYLAIVFFTLLAGMPSLGRAREKARRISCQADMKQIVFALNQYADDWGGAYPPDLRTLSDTQYLTDKGIYRCPSRRRPNPEFSDYQYFGKGRKFGEKPFPILRDREKNHPGKYRNVLYSGGQVAAETGDRK